VNSDAENPRITGSEAAFHLIKIARHTLVGADEMIGGILEADARWALRGLGVRRKEVGSLVRSGIVIGPFGFVARAEFVHYFDSIPNGGTGIQRNAVFDVAFVPINEET